MPRTIAPIHKCPEEILLMVFCSVVEQDSIQVADLLQVCRRWYGIVVRAPRLWNHIDLTFRRDSRISAVSDMFMQHIMTYLQRSASSRLHIRLNMRDLPTKQSKPFEHPSKVMEAITVLVGENGEHMKRWETVEIIFPYYFLHEYVPHEYAPNEYVPHGYIPHEREDDYVMDEAIWRVFSYPAPNLTKLWIREAHFRPQDIQPHEQFTTFLQLESLTDLRINGDLPRWDFFGLNFKSVTTLMLDADIGSYRQTLAISQFTRLQHLTIDCDGWPAPPSTSATIRLPSLQTLSMREYTPTTTIWDIPVLKMLEFDGYNDSLTSVELPNAQASHVSWTSYAWDQRDPVQIEIHLQLLLSQYTEMRKLTIPIVARSIWEGDVLTQQRGSRIVEVDFI